VSLATSTATVVLVNDVAFEVPHVERLALEREVLAHGHDDGAPALCFLVAVRKHSRQLVMEPLADWPSHRKTIVPLLLVADLLDDLRGDVLVAIEEVQLLRLLTKFRLKPTHYCFLRIDCSPANL